MKGKLISSNGYSYGDIGIKAFRYEGMDYFVGDVVRPMQENGIQKEDTIVIFHEFKYFPMWYASMEYFAKERYHLTKIRNWDDLKDKEIFCHKSVYVQLEKEIDKTIKLNLSEGEANNLLDSLVTVCAAMQVNDHLQFELDTINMKVKAKIIQLEPKEFVFDFINKTDIK